MQNRPALFLGRHFEDVIIIRCVRWYLRYSLSYRDLEGDDGGAWPVGGSRHDLALGPALCTDSESASASRTSASQSLLAGGRNVRPGRRRLDVPVSSSGFSR